MGRTLDWAFMHQRRSECLAQKGSHLSVFRQAHDANGWRPALMFREVVAKEARTIAQFGQIEPVGELPRHPDPGIVHMVENAKFERSLRQDVHDEYSNSTACVAGDPSEHDIALAHVAAVSIGCDLATDETCRLKNRRSSRSSRLLEEARDPPPRDYVSVVGRSPLS
jgi:hypothetical protein